MGAEKDVYKFGKKIYKHPKKAAYGCLTLFALFFILFLMVKACF